MYHKSIYNYIYLSVFCKKNLSEKKDIINYKIEKYDNYTT